MKRHDDILTWRQDDEDVLQFEPRIVARETWMILARGWFAYTLIGVTILAPVVLGALWYGRRHPVHRPSVEVVVLFTLVVTFLSQVATATMTPSAVEALRGRSTTMAERLRRGSRTWASTLGVSVLTGALVSIGVLLCVVPGMYVMSRLCVAVPCAVMEHARPLRALRRSWTLTADHALQIGASEVVYACWLLSQPRGWGGPSSIVITPYLVLYVGLAVLVVVHQGVSSAVTYVHLRRVRENADLDELARVFD